MPWNDSEAPLSLPNQAFPSCLPWLRPETRCQTHRYDRPLSQLKISTVELAPSSSFRLCTSPLTVNIRVKPQKLEQFISKFSSTSIVEMCSFHHDLYDTFKLISGFNKLGTKAEWGRSIISENMYRFKNHQHPHLKS